MILRVYIFLFFSSFGFFAQDLNSYEFNYLSHYEIKFDSEETPKYHRYILANSKNADYFLHIFINAENNQIAANLYDIKQETNLELKLSNFSLNDEIIDMNIESQEINKLGSHLMYFESSKIKNTYQWKTSNDTIVLNLKTFKNKKQKNLDRAQTANVFYFVKTNKINQQFFTTPLVFAEDFKNIKIDDDLVVVKSVYQSLNKNKNTTIETLVNLNNINYILHL